MAPRLLSIISETLVLVTLLASNFVHSELTVKDIVRDGLTWEIVNGYRSPDRPFYVNIVVNKVVDPEYFSYRTTSVNCGGAIIDESWVVTSASCLTEEIESLFVEIGNFSEEFNIHEFRSPLKVIYHNGFNSQNKQNDIALIKLSVPVDRKRVIGLCESDADYSTILASCGMGITNPKEPNSIPTTLQEAHFWEKRRGCRLDNVCAYEMRKGNICEGDPGSPLYTLAGSRNGSVGVGCLYGVASFARFEDTCSGGSFYTRIPHFHWWIVQKIKQFSDPDAAFGD